MKGCSRRINRQSADFQARYWYRGGIKRATMKSAIALCLLTVFYMADAFNPLDSLRKQLTTAKSSMESTINKLDRLERNTQFNTQMKVSNKRNEQMQGFNNYLNPTIDAIRAEVEDSKTKGKDAQPCYDKAITTFRDISNTAWNDAERCVQSADNSMQNKLSFIENLLQSVRQIVMQMDSIFPNCFNSNLIQMQTCVAIQLGTTNVAARKIESEANSAEYTAMSASNDVVLQATRCVSDVVSAARTKITNGRLDAIKCVKAL